MQCIVVYSPYSSMNMDLTHNCLVADLTTRPLNVKNVELNLHGIIIHGPHVSALCHWLKQLWGKPSPHQ